MAERTTHEDLRLNLIVNGDQYKKELGDLENSTRKLNAENKTLRADKKKLIAAEKQEGAEFENVTAAIKLNNAELKENGVKMDALRKKIGLTGLTYRQLISEKKRLSQIRDNLTKGTADWKKYNMQLQKVEAQLRKVRNGGKGVRGAFNNIAKGFNKFALLGASVIATLTGIGFGIKKLVDSYIELTDTLADVRKTTGLTDEGVKELYETLKLIDTRTANDNLLGLARIAGKLGVEGKEDIEGFVKAADQINVALGEDLGGDVEETIRQVGKLTDIFKVTDKYGLEESMLKVGSAINALGASSTANEQQIVEFGKRVGGVASQANVAIADMFGLGATLDILGQKTEASGTAINKVLVDMFVDTAEYARIAGMGVDEFTELLNTDSNEAMIRFFEGLNGNNEGLKEMAEKLDIVGQDGARSTQVLASLAGNTDLLREQQALSNLEFEKGTSLTEEFNIKNNTLAAKLDKAKKRISEVSEELGEKLAPGMVVVAGWTGRLLRTIVNIIDFFNKYKKVIITVSAAIVAYTVAVKVNSIAVKASILLKKAKNAITIKEIWLNTKLGKGLQSLWKTMVANPYAAVAALAIAGATALFLYLTNTKEATSKQVLLNDAMAEAQKATAGEKAELDSLLLIAKDETQSKEDRLKAIKKLNEISPEYLGNLTLENVNTKEGIALIDKYIEALDKKALAQALQNKLTELYEQKLAKETSTMKDNLSVLEASFTRRSNWAKIAAENRNKEIALIDEEINRTKELIGEKTKLGEVSVAKDIIQGTSPTATGGISTDKAKKNREKAADEAFKTREAELKRILDLEKAMAVDATEFLDEEQEEVLDDYFGHLKTKLDILGGSLDEQMQLELFNMQTSKEFAILNEEEKQLALQNIKDKYAQIEANNKQQALKELSREMEGYARAAMNIYSSFVNFQNVKDENRIKGLDIKKQRELDSLVSRKEKGLITEEEFNEKRLSTEEKFAKKKEKIEIEAFERNKKLKIATAIIDGAAAIMRIAADVPKVDFGVTTGILIAAQAIQTGLQVAAISATQYAQGKYPVMGADDGKLYNANYTGAVKTGYYTDTSLGIFSEKEPEIVIDGPTTRNIMQFDPGIWDAINYWRAPQYASGTAIPSNTTDSNTQIPDTINIKIEFPAAIKAVIDQEGVYDINETITIIKEIETNASG